MTQCNECEQQIEVGYYNEHESTFYCESCLPEGLKEVIDSYREDDDFENCPIYYTDDFIKEVTQ